VQNARQKRASLGEMHKAEPVLTTDQKGGGFDPSGCAIVMSQDIGDTLNP
jgi:hypothetical protein